MQTSDLDRRLTLLEPVTGKDADGQVIQSYADRGTVWANIAHRPGSEAFQQARMEARDPATIAIRVSELSLRVSAEWRAETDRDRYEIRGNPFLSQDRAFVIFQVEGQRK